MLTLAGVNGNANRKWRLYPVKLSVVVIKWIQYLFNFICYWVYDIWKWPSCDLFIVDCLKWALCLQARLPWDTDGELGLEGTRSMCLLEQQDTNDRTLCSTPGIPSHTPSPTQPPAQSPFLPPLPGQYTTTYLIQTLSLSLPLFWGGWEKTLGAGSNLLHGFDIGLI